MNDNPSRNVSSKSEINWINIQKKAALTVLYNNPFTTRIENQIFLFPVMCCIFSFTTCTTRFDPDQTAPLRADLSDSNLIARLASMTTLFGYDIELGLVFLSNPTYADVVALT